MLYMLQAEILDIFVQLVDKYAFLAEDFRRITVYYDFFAI